MEYEFIKYPKIPHLDASLNILDNPVDVFEKIDGGNTQIRNINGRVIPGVRSKFLGSEKLMRMPWFKGFQNFVMSNYSFYNLPENLVMYGEWSAQHTLEYFPEFVNKFFVLDVFDTEKGKFLPYQIGKESLEKAGIGNVLYLEQLIAEKKTSLDELKKLVTKSPYRDGSMEGVVVKDYQSTPQKFAKLWTSIINAEKGRLSTDDVRRAINSYLDENDGDIDPNKLVDEIISEYESLGYRLDPRNLKDLVTSNLKK
ncbi:MAG TPA: RNA ligase family protein [Candidatus Nanoarchaeia archaeon]|nr:RNA ligase family protein [Candidatus Nanoarchaeia archaeon]